MTIDELKRNLKRVADVHRADKLHTSYLNITALCEDTIRCIEELEEELKQLRNQQGWIFTSEALPEIRKDVLLFLRDGDISTGYRSEEYFYVDCISTKYVKTQNVIAWMPLPNPPQEGDKE